LVVVPDGASAAVWAARGVVTAPALRLLPPSAPPDAQVLTAMATLRRRNQGDPSAWQADGTGARRPYIGLDMAAWLGSEEAHSLALPTGQPQRRAYDDALARGRKAWETLGESGRHASVHASTLDALSTYLKPSAFEGVMTKDSPEWRLHKVESTLSAWAMLRNQAQYFGRSPLPAVPVAVSQEIDPSRVSVWVEAHPEAIVKLVGVLAQLWNGMTALGVVSSAGTARLVIAELDAMVRTALTVSAWTSQGLALSPELAAQVGTLPQRLLQLEAWLMPSQVHDAAVATDVHHDLESGQVTHVATGAWDWLAVVIRVPGGSEAKPEWRLAMGLVLPYFEYMRSARERQREAGWRETLRTERPVHPQFAASYRER
jgi:Protein of unknown function (DUF3160)